MRDRISPRPASHNTRATLGAVVIGAAASLALVACAGHSDPNPQPNTRWSDGWWQPDAGAPPPAPGRDDAAAGGRDAGDRGPTAVGNTVQVLYLVPSDRQERPAPASFPAPRIACG